jgi:hypothetical protein
MTPYICDVFIAFSVCFALMNKVEFLRRIAFFDAMLSCSFCTGFHVGWIIFIAELVVRDAPVQGLKQVIVGFGWAFGSALACYIFDLGLKLLEKEVEK